MKFATKTIHTGYDTHANQRAVSPPVYQTSLFRYDTVGESLPFSYARGGTPTRAALEEALAALEGAAHGMAFASGMAAIDAVMRAILRPGDTVVAVADIYGGAFRLLTQVMIPMGIRVVFADLSDPDACARVLQDGVKLLWLESPSNPLLKVLDIAQIAALARARGILVAIDNTFATPYLQTPLALGVDVVVHSATKYLSGHSDVLLGLVAVDDPDLFKSIRFIQNAAGAVPGPQDCFLTLRGMKTLHVRMDRHCENAARVARFLQDHPAIEQVFYPGLEQHPGHAVAMQQMRKPGGVVSFYLKEDTREAAARVCERLQYFTLADSLGGVESLINHSATMSHGSMPAAEQAARGIREGLLRLSVGIEDVEDLMADLAQALNGA